MKYINAKIKSREELYHRMLNGEIFYILVDLDLYKVFYDSRYINTPFRVSISIKNVGEENSQPISNLADAYSEMCIAKKMEWWDYPLPDQGLLVGRKTMVGANPILITSIRAEIATTSMGTRFNVHDLYPLTPDDPRLFKEIINEI